MDNQVRYDIGEKKIVYEPISVAQEFRRYEVHNPWENIKDSNPLKDMEEINK